MEENNIRELIAPLLYNFWIDKEKDEELYYNIKYNQDKIKDFIAKNLGNKLIIHNRFIKLEKIPTIVKKNYGIPNFTRVFDYVILSICLMFLEDKARGDIFLLSNLVEYIKTTSITLELDHTPDWNKIKDRRSMLTVIEFLKDLKVVKLKDEDKVNFIESKDSEALYEIMGTSNYIARLFDTEINNFETPEEFLKSEFINQDEEKGDVRRYKVFRNILYMPSVNMIDIKPSEMEYIKRNRGYIKNECSKKLDMEVEITNNMTLLYDDTTNVLKDNFPNSKKICEIVLMINSEIVKDIENNLLKRNEKEIIITDKSYLKSIIRRVKENKKPYIGKTYEKLNFEKFYQEIVEYMESYNFIELKNDKVYIYPLVKRMIGKTMEVPKNEQVTIFGGSDEKL